MYNKLFTTNCELAPVTANIFLTFHGIIFVTVYSGPYIVVFQSMKHVLNIIRAYADIEYKCPCLIKYIIKYTIYINFLNYSTMSLLHFADFSDSDVKFVWKICMLQTKDRRISFSRSWLLFIYKYIQPFYRDNISICYSDIPSREFYDARWS